MIIGTIKEARDYLNEYNLDGVITFRGVPAGKFKKEELIKIIAVTGGLIEKKSKET